MHFGEITFGVDERGEVGLLTRDIRIQASADAEEPYFGGHVMAMAGSKMYVSGVELSRIGQHLTLARYPMHWHLVGDATGQYIRNSAIHDTFNRCVTVHGTNNLRVENNVTYNTVGHCFFLEDGIETGNQYVRNLGIMTKCRPTKPCVPTNLAADGSRSGSASGASGQTSEDVLRDPPHARRGARGADDCGEGASCGSVGGRRPADGAKYKMVAGACNQRYLQLWSGAA